MVSIVTYEKIYPPGGVRVVGHRFGSTQITEKGDAVDLPSIFAAYRVLLRKRHGHLAARFRPGSGTLLGADFCHKFLGDGF